MRIDQSVCSLDSGNVVDCIFVFAEVLILNQTKVGAFVKTFASIYTDRFVEFVIVVIRQPQRDEFVVAAGVVFFVNVADAGFGVEIRRR